MLRISGRRSTSLQRQIARFPREPSAGCQIRRTCRRICVLLFSRARRHLYSSVNETERRKPSCFCVNMNDKKPSFRGVFAFRKPSPGVGKVDREASRMRGIRRKAVQGATSSALRRNSGTPCPPCAREGGSRSEARLTEGLLIVRIPTLQPLSLLRSQLPLHRGAMIARTLLGATSSALRRNSGTPCPP